MASLPPIGTASKGMTMQTVNVVKSFTLTLDDGTKREFLPGSRMMEDELANHWFVKPHLGEAPGPDEGLEDQGLATLEAMEADLKTAQSRFEQEKATAEADLLAKANEISDAEIALKEAQLALANDRTALDQERAAFESAKRLAADATLQSTKKK